MFSCRLRSAAVFCLALPFALAAAAQDTRTVTQPVIPPSCTVLSSTLAIVAGEPAAETTFDTSRIQTALNACPAGQAVELALSGTNDAFLIQPITIPSGVTLLIDGGVTVFASRNPADYQINGGETCGTAGTKGNGCNNLISVGTGSTTTGSAIMGYGIIDGRGEDKLLLNGVASTSSWWDIANAANTAGGAQNNFVLMQTSKANSFTLYGITVKNSPMFHLKWNGTNGYTVWDVKVITPYTGRNTDGLDIAGTNVTVMNSSISDGDDDVAISGSSAASNVTVASTNTYSGHGISIGSYTQGGFTNLLVNSVNMAGTAADSNATGLRIKSADDRGGLVQNVTYQNMCLQNMKTMISLTPFYNTNTGTLIPQFKNVYFHNLNFLSVGTIGIQGYDINHITSVQFDNVVFPSTLTSASVTPAAQDATITLGPGEVYPSLLQTWTGTGVSVTGTAPATNTSAYACTSASFPYVTGDLFLGGTANNKQTTSINLHSSVTLSAMVQPAMSQVAYNGSTAAAALTNPISFYEGTTLLGTATLAANGTLASLVYTPTVSGIHTYTAQYPADANYATLAFGSVTVTVTGTTATTTTVVATPPTSTYGASTSITATVTGTAGAAPTGTVQFYDNGTPLGSAVTVTTLSAPAGTSTAVLSTALVGGTHSITAVYFGDLTYNTSTSATGAPVTVNTASSTTTLVASPTSSPFGPSITLTATVTPGAGTAKPTSSVNFYDGTTLLGTTTVNTSGVATFVVTLPTVGTHSFTANYTGDSNYSASPSSSVQSVIISLATSTTTLAVSPQTPTPATPVTFTATVTNTAGVVATGTVTFKDNGTSIGTGTLNASGVATLVLPTLTLGANSITAVYGGDSNFATSTSSAQSVPVAFGTVNTALVVSPTTSGFGSSVTFTATLTDSVGITPTGTVTFKDGSTTIGSAVAVSGTGVAAMTISTLSAGTHSITANYSGDGNFNASSSSAQTLTVNATPFTVTVPAAVSASIGAATSLYTVTVTPGSAGYSGVVTLACSSPVTYVGCAISPATVTLSGTAAQTSTVNIIVGATVSQARPAHSNAVYAVLLPFAALLLLPFTRRRATRGLGLCLLLCGLAVAALGISGCSGATSATAARPPTGNQTLTITATNPVGYISTATITLTVTN